MVGRPLALEAFKVGYKGWDLVHGVNTRPLICKAPSEARFFGELPRIMERALVYLWKGLLDCSSIVP